MKETTPSKKISFNDLPVAEAHCDGPCGVYDPSSARVAAEAVRSMTKKILDLVPPEPGDAQAVAGYLNTVGRYVAIKEEQAELAKRELLLLWTDYFKPEHLGANPDLHTQVWEACKLGSHVKQHVDMAKAVEFKAALEKIGQAFADSKK